MPGSSLVRQAMAEVNTMQDGTYDLQGHFPCDDAQDLWDRANHFQNYRQFDDAIRAYGDFIRAFPGHDNYDDAWYHIGVCQQEANKLFKTVNEAKGPEDIFRRGDELRRAAGGALSTLPPESQLIAAGDAVSAYAVVVNNLIGSNLRDESLREIAKIYEVNELTDDAAFTYQEKIIHFPYETEPDEGDMRGKGALCKTLRWYADPKNYGEQGANRYNSSPGAPGRVPARAVQDRNQFLALRSYLPHAEHAYEMQKHIPYRLSVDDLRQDARYYLACATCSAAVQPRSNYSSPSSVPPRLSRARSVRLRSCAGGDQATRQREGCRSVQLDHRRPRPVRAWTMPWRPGPARAAASVRPDLGGDRSSKSPGLKGATTMWVGENAVVAAPWIVSAGCASTTCRTSGTSRRGNSTPGRVPSQPSASSFVRRPTPPAATAVTSWL
jgi:hypothetical protein